MPTVAQYSPVYLPSACLFSQAICSPWAECPSRDTPCGHSLIFVETFLVEYCQPGRGLSYSLTALGLTFGTRVEMWGLSRTFVPGASTKDIAGPGPHRAGKAMCNMWRDFWGSGEAKGQHPFLCTVFMLLFR